MAEKTRTSIIKAAPKPEDFEWTEQRELALEYFMRGLPQTQIAEQVGVHRNTIRNWISHPGFIARARQWFAEYTVATRNRRIIETGKFGNRVSKVANQAMTVLEEMMEKSEFRKGESIPGKQLRMVRELMYEFRMLREEERKDFGDDVKRIETRGLHLHGGTVQVQHGTGSTSFRDFLQNQLDSGVIDAEFVDTSKDDATAVMSMVEQSIIDGDILDIMDAEDAEMEGGK